MDPSTDERISLGRGAFGQFAFPPNELGYCGPADAAQNELAAHARQFDGAWPYLQALAEVTDIGDPLDARIVHSYWVGGPLLAEVDPDELLARLREAFAGQVTGLLERVSGKNILAHHSFHVFVVYPWVGFLDRDPATPLRVLQDCRIRWGTVESVHRDHAVISSPPLRFEAGRLKLGEPVAERVRWRKDGASLAPAPVPGSTVAAHWDWVCATLSPADRHELSDATTATLDLVNAVRSTGNHH